MAGDEAELVRQAKQDRRAYGPEGRQESGTPPAEPPPAPITIPAVLDMRVLPDGRVGALLSHDLGGYGLRHFLIFIEVDGQWLIDEEVIVERDYASAGLIPNYHVILADDLFFEPNRLVVPENPDVYLQLENVGEVPHSLVFEELNIEILLNPGESKSILLSISPGEYEFYSDIPGQRAAGMEGVLVVVAEATPESGDVEVDCDTAIVIAASPEVEVGPGTPVVIDSQATAANSTPVAWEGTCD